MIKKQYLTFRFFWLNEKEFLNPKLVIKKSFNGVNSLKFHSVTSDPKKDGRVLGYLEYDDSELPLEVILEAMVHFAPKLKTPEEALSFAKGINDKYYLNGDMLDIETQAPEEPLTLTEDIEDIDDITPGEE